MASYQQISQLPRPPAPSPAGPSQADVFTVRIPRDKNRKFTIMKFGTASTVDFAKVGEQPVKMERENNLKEYRTANDLDTMPKFGAGSEYGRDQKEESRRKKYGIMLKKYDPDNQPWHLKIGAGKQAKRWKGVREGTISENTSYYIFTKAPDGAFEAFPVEEWYNFSPIIKYKYLNSDEAEEEFSRRDKTLNFFSIMVKKRLKKEEDLADDEEEGIKGPKKSKKKKNKRDLVLTDMDDWDDLKMSDDDDDSDRDSDRDDDDGGKPKKKKSKAGPGRRVKNSKKNSDDEAVEESDEGDFDDREVDYMSDSGSDDSLSGTEAQEKGKSKYDEKGVDQEDGLRKILDSDAEEEEQQEEEEEDPDKDEEKEEEPSDGKKDKKKGEDNSSSSSSEADSDIEKDAKLASDIFLQPRQAQAPGETDAAASTSAAMPDVGSPSPDKVKEKALKRKAEKSADGKSTSSKKHKSEGSEGISDDAIRRYLMRKPMTTKDLLTKFKAKKLNMSNQRMADVIAQILKRIDPEKEVRNKVLYLSLKKPE